MGELGNGVQFQTPDQLVEEGFSSAKISESGLDGPGHLV